MVVRSGQLHIPTEQHYMGPLCLRVQPAHGPPVPARTTGREAHCEAPRSTRPRGAPRCVADRRSYGFLLPT